MIEGAFLSAGGAGQGSAPGVAAQAGQMILVQAVADSRVHRGLPGPGPWNELSRVWGLAPTGRLHAAYQHSGIVIADLFAVAVSQRCPTGEMT